MSRVRSLVASGRPGVTLSAGVAASATVAFAGASSLSTVIFSGIAMILMAMLAMVFNDVYDFDKDRAAGIVRPIASGRLPRRTALLYALLLVVLALLAGLVASRSEPNSTVTSATSIGWLVVGIVCGLAYSPFARRLPLLKGLYTAVGCALPLAYGAAVGGVRVPAMAFTVAVLFNLGREMFLDAHDFAADMRAGLRTVAVVLGRGSARATGIVIMFAAAALMVAASHTALGVAAGAFSVLLLGAALLSRRVSDEGLRHVTRLVLAVGALGVASTVA